MASMVEAAGVALACRERGAGAPVLLVHGIAGDAEALDPLAEALADGARVIAYDRRGYGESGAPEPYEATTVHEQSEDAAALLRARAGAPAVAFGDGFGALVVLDLLVRHRDLVRAAVLADPPLFAFVPEATDAMSADRLALDEAIREGGPEHAVERLLGPGHAPEAVARARASHRAVFADLGGLASWPVTRAELRAIDAPVAVVITQRAPPHVVKAADALTALLPDARRDADIPAAVRSLL